MSDFYLQFLGSGDAFHSGGKNHTSFFLKTPGSNFLIDCGMTTLKALKKHDISTNDIDVIVITHFHGDHFGGLPLLILEMAKVEKRTKPLHILSPPDLEQKLYDLFILLYTSAESILHELEIHYIDYFAGESVMMSNFQLKAFPVIHSEPSMPHGIRLEINDKIIAYSGDTEWTENLLHISENADLFILECNYLSQEGKGHLSWEMLKGKIDQFTSKNLILTHLGEEMLKFARIENLQIAEDGNITEFN